MPKNLLLPSGIWGERLPVSYLFVVSLSEHIFLFFAFETRPHPTQETSITGKLFPYLLSVAIYFFLQKRNKKKKKKEEKKLSFSLPSFQLPFLSLALHFFFAFFLAFIPSILPTFFSFISFPYLPDFLSFPFTILFSFFPSSFLPFSSDLFF